jgi:uncharacterized repeat protein (TIGR01451 family)
MIRFPITARLGAALASLASVALLVGACSDDRTPTTSLAPGAQPSFAISVSSSNFQQCANGGSGGEPCFYINGVLNDSKSLYHESDVIAERFVIPGLTIGHTYRLVFDYGFEKAVNPGHMNYDFLAGWDVTLGALANPCGDPLGNGSADIRGVCTAGGATKGTRNFQVIPDSVFVKNAPLGLKEELEAALGRFKTAHANDVNPNAVRFDIVGGSFPADAFDKVTYTVNGDDVTGRFTVRFTAGQATVMLLWGGHFADSRDYRLAVWDDDKNAATTEQQGNLTGAAGQSGAPFHFTQQYIKNLTSGDSTGIGSLSNNVQGSVLEPVPKARISMVAGATNGIGESHTFTVTLQKDLDNGAGVVPAAGEHVTVTLTGAGGAVATPDTAASTCDNAGPNTNANGQCTIKFTSNTAGTVTGSATATLVIGATSVTVTTDGSGDNSAAPVKTFVAGTIDWLKHDGSGALLGGAVFTVCRKELWDSDLNGVGGYTDIADVCFDVSDDISLPDDTDAPPGDRDGTAGEFKLGGLILGKYSVKEKTAPSGYILDPDSIQVSLSTTTDSVHIATAFVNISPPVLEISKTPDAAGDLNPNGTVHPGERAEFTITISNTAPTGASAATTVQMIDTLPAGLTWTEKVDKSECTITTITVSAVSRDSLSCNIASIAAGASFSVTVQSNIIQVSFLQQPSETATALEIDGDLDSTGTTGRDWKNLSSSIFSCSSTPTKGCDIDKPTGKNDNAFGQGTKEDSPIPTVVFGSIPNNKSDLRRFYVASERVLSSDYVYLGWTRVQEPNGTTNMDFELNQSADTNSNGTPVRSANDILVRYDLSQGGTNPQLSFHKWVTSGASSQCEASNSVPCWGTKRDLTNDVQAAINTTAVTDIGGGPLSARTFGEAAINLANFFEAGVCTNFGQAYLKSRSSDAFGSEMKDFIAPIPVEISTCNPVTLDNRAYSRAANFAPTGGALNDWIRNSGKIEVTEAP